MPPPGCSCAKAEGLAQRQSNRHTNKQHFFCINLLLSIIRQLDIAPYKFPKTVQVLTGSILQSK